MLSVVIPALNPGPRLAETLEAAASADEIVVVDGGSEDGTPALATRLGARVVTAPRGRGRQLARGAEVAGGDWLLFLHADTRLSPDWLEPVERFIAERADNAGYFRLAFDDATFSAGRTAWLANWRARRLGLPYGDQGLLLSRALYDAVGGFAPLPLMEDVDIVRRLGRRRLVMLSATVVTSADKYRQQGWIRRSARNLVCLSLYFLGVPPSRIAKLYG